MDHIEKLLKDCEQGSLGRRQLLQALGLAATAAFGAGVLPKAAAAYGGQAAAGSRTFPVTHVNHLSYASPNYAKTRDFYVDLFGMRVVWDNGKQCGLEFGDPKAPNGLYIRDLSTNTGRVPNVKANVSHIAFAMNNFLRYKAAIKAEIDRRALTNVTPDGEHGWIFDDPNGYMLNITPITDPAMYPGAGGPCLEAASAKCKEGLAEGKKNLANVPKPSGKGFNAYAYSHIVLNCKDIAKGKEFYQNFMGMKVIHDQPADPAKKQTAQCFLRFGQNTLYLRPAGPDGKPFCNHFALVVKDFDQAKVEAELTRRGLKPKPDSKLGWTIADPDGLRIEVAGWGLPEHIANECHGAAPNCPGGDRG